MRLRLIQLPSNPALGVYPSYRLAAAVQEVVRRQFLLAKESAAAAARRVSASGDHGSSHDTLLSLLVPFPPPTVIAFTPTPTYTLGRRQNAAGLTPSERAALEAPLTVALRSDDADDADGDVSAAAAASEPSSAYEFQPRVVEAPRGGLTTYHGPGQAVLWPVLDLKSALFERGAAGPLTVRAYSRLLETTTAETLRRRYGIEAFYTEDSGVWVGAESAEPTEPAEQADHGPEQRKIAALGVHLRRNISALGVAVNLDMPVRPASAHSPVAASQPSESNSESNPWLRFTPCGIDKGVTCVADEARRRFGHVPAAWDLQPARFAAKWAAALAGQLGLRDAEVDVVDALTVTRLVVEGEALLDREEK